MYVCKCVNKCVHVLVCSVCVYIQCAVVLCVLLLCQMPNMLTTTFTCMIGEQVVMGGYDLVTSS